MLSRNHLFLILVSLPLSLSAQVDPPNTDDDDDFDYSQFEPAAPPSMNFATNKVLAQSPTTLVGLFYDYHLPHDLTAGNITGDPASGIADDVRINPAQALMATANIPIMSRTKGLINLNVLFQRQWYNVEGSNGHPLSRSLSENGLTRFSSLFTYFKPLDDKRFFLFQGGVELNGDYSFPNFQPAGTLRVPAAVLYGWKKSDHLMYAFGLSRTYLGGSLNYVPIIYYFHTFKDQRWGIEAVAPARASLRYRFNSLTLLSFGWNTMGATYRLNDFETFSQEFGQDNPGDLSQLLEARDVELRRSEVRVGFTFQRQLTGFFWLNMEAGYRVNYSFELDEGGDFLRFWGSDEPYFIENDLRNTPYFTVGISYMSP
jgi:hypothetical protein